MKRILITFLLFLIIGCNNIANRISIRYYRRKAPGHQSLVDFFFIGFLTFYSHATISSCLTFYTGFLYFEYINLHEMVAYIISGFVEALNLFTLLKLLTFLFVKYISIYHSTFTTDMEEKYWDKILTRIQGSISIILIFFNYFLKYYEKKQLMLFNILTIGNGGGGTPAMVNVPVIVLCVLLALVLQIRIEIDNYHYGDNAGWFLKMIQSLKNQENEGRNIQKYGYIGILIFVFFFLFFFALLPLIQMSNFRVFVGMITVTSLALCPPISHILKHDKIKDFACKLIKEKFVHILKIKPTSPMYSLTV